MDAIETLTAEIAKLQKRVKAAEEKGQGVDALLAKIDALEAKLAKSPDFGAWD